MRRTSACARAGDQPFFMLVFPPPTRCSNFRTGIELFDAHETVQ
jgi:hypothetical protein